MAGANRTGTFVGPSFEFTGNSTVGQSVFFDQKSFDTLVKDHGYLVKWEKAAFCPNRPRSGSHADFHAPNCDFCDGRGYIYFAADTGVEMIVQSAKLVQQFYAQGRWDQGSVIVTPRPGYQISWWDRLTLENGTSRFPELVTRQRDVPDLLRFEPLVVEYVAWVDRNQELVTFPKSAYTINKHRLTWRSGGPDVGSRYTISYCFRPRYVVQEMLHHHRESPEAPGQPITYPVQAVAKLDFQIRDMSRDDVTPHAEDPFIVTREVG